MKVSSEEAERSMRETTESELKKLQMKIDNQGFKRIEQVSDSEEYESSVESESDEEPRKVRVVSKNNSIENKIYEDNRKLWKKIHNLKNNNIELENKVHYYKLEINNLQVKISEMKERVSYLTEENKALEKESKCYFLEISKHETFAYYLTFACVLEFIIIVILACVIVIV